jgi:hypothetical protein
MLAADLVRNATFTTTQFLPLLPLLPRLEVREPRPGSAGGSAETHPSAAVLVGERFPVCRPAGPACARRQRGPGHRAGQLVVVEDSGPPSHEDEVAVATSLEHVVRPEQ